MCIILGMCCKQDMYIFWSDRYTSRWSIVDNQQTIDLVVIWSIMPLILRHTVTVMKQFRPSIIWSNHHSPMRGPGKVSGDLLGTQNAIIHNRSLAFMLHDGWLELHICRYVYMRTLVQGPGKWLHPIKYNYTDVIMGAIASELTSLTIVYSTVYSDADQRKHQSSASLAFVREFTGDRWIPRTNGQ